MDRGVQAIAPTSEGAGQTDGYRSLNAITQYVSEDFVTKHQVVIKEDENSSSTNDNAVDAGLKSLADFLSKESVSVAVEESLQQNETIDAFQGSFTDLGDSDIK